MLSLDFTHQHHRHRPTMPQFSGVSSTNCKLLSNPSGRQDYWEEVDMHREAQFFPDAVEQYANGGGAAKEPQRKLSEKLRQHLAYLRWKIEHNIGNAKFRYTSPNGKVFYSLRIICQHLSPNSNSVAEVEKIKIKIKNVVVSDCDDDDDDDDEDDDDLRCLKFNSEPHHDPEAVFEWVKLSRAGQMGESGRAISLRVKNHLLFHGWLLFYVDKGNNRHELRYRPPPPYDSKAFITLSSACHYLIGREENNKPNVGIVTNTRVKRKIGDDTTTDAGKRVQETGSSDMGMCISGNGANTRVKRKIGADTTTDGAVTNNTGKRIREIESSDMGMCISGNGVNGDVGLPKKKKRKMQVADGKSKLSLGKARNIHKKSMLSLLIDSNLVAPMAQVYYRNRKGDQKLKEGWVTRDGIKCMCCNKVFALTKFEAHAGSTNHRPAANIILEDGRTLFELHNEYKGLSGEHRKEEDGIGTKGDAMNDNLDICSVCRFGGDLVLCDQCPSSYHTSCIGLEEIPQGDWFCPSCCCAVCSENCGSGSSFFTCCQCEKKHHAGCLSLEASSGEKWFCSKECGKIHSHLEQLIGKPIALASGADNLTWTLVKSTKSNLNNDKVKKSLGGALRLMHECFEPIKDVSTGRDIVENLIYSRGSDDPNIANFQGFYTVILEKNGVFITVANVRIYGKKVAEMPLVSTSFQYRRLGMCKILMDELEKQLREMGVERLVLPAVPHVIETWTGSFGFSKMTSSERLQLLQYTFVEFQGTIMCQKLLMTD